MRSRGSLLIVGLLLVGCGRDASTATPASVPSPRPQARTILRSNLEIRCAHVIVDPDLISGVLTARNTGKEPLAVLARLDPPGAYQWRLTVRGEAADNPQHSWISGGHRENVLLPGEIRYAQFHITRSRSRVRIGESEWWFVIGESDIPSPTSEKDAAEHPRFTEGLAVSLVMDATPMNAQNANPAFSSALWGGIVTVRSEELGSVQELVGRIQGQRLA